MPAPLSPDRRAREAFAVTFDYRCPFARNAHEHLVTAIEHGATWDVRYVPFSLGQVHVAEGEPDIWETPEKDSGLLALQVGVVVRDRLTEAFPAVHRAIFAARHDQGEQFEEAVLRRILEDHGVDADEVFASVSDGTALKTVQIEHEAVAASHSVFGVPTFIAGDEAVFVRLMNRPQGDGDLATSTIDRVVGMLTGWPELNEFKRTTTKR